LGNSRGNPGRYKEAKRGRVRRGNESRAGEVIRVGARARGERTEAGVSRGEFSGGFESISWSVE
jgi:hypothetical protein